MLMGKRKIANEFQDVANSLTPEFKFIDRKAKCYIVGVVEGFSIKITAEFDNKRVLVETYKWDTNNGDAKAINHSKSIFHINHVNYEWLMQMITVMANTLKSAVSTKILDESQVEEFVEVVRDQVYDRMHTVMSECLDQGIDDTMSKIDVNAVLAKFNGSE